MTYKDGRVEGWKPNQDGGKGPAHTLNRDGRGQPIAREPLKKGWRKE